MFKVGDRVERLGGHPGFHGPKMKEGDKFEVTEVEVGEDHVRIRLVGLGHRMFYAEYFKLLAPVSLENV